MALQAKDVMQTKVRTVGPDISLPDLERAFLESRVSGFPVVDGERLVGVISRSDIVRKLVAEQSVAEYVSDYHRDLGGFDESRGEESLTELATRAGSRLASARAADLMSRSPVAVAPGDSLRDVARTLSERQIHRVPVVDGGRLKGIITSFDLVKLIADGKVVPA